MVQFLRLLEEVMKLIELKKFTELIEFTALMWLTVKQPSALPRDIKHD